MPFRDEYCQPLQELIRWARRPWYWRRRPDRRGDIMDSSVPLQTTCHQSREESVPVGLAGEYCIERLEAFCCLEQKPHRGRRTSRRKDDLAAQQVCASVSDLRERSRLRRGEQFKGGTERAGVVLDLRCRKRPVGSATGIEGQRGRALEESCRGR